MKKDQKRNDKVAVGCRSRKDSDRFDRKDSVDCRGRIDRKDFVDRIDRRDQSVVRKYFQGKQKGPRSQRQQYQNPDNLRRNWDILQQRQLRKVILQCRILVVRNHQIMLLDRH